jgi:hypothetical protein
MINIEELELEICQLKKFINSKKESCSYKRPPMTERFVIFEKKEKLVS